MWTEYQEHLCVVLCCLTLYCMVLILLFFELQSFTEAEHRTFSVFKSGPATMKRFIKLSLNEEMLLINIFGKNVEQIKYSTHFICFLEQQPNKQCFPSLDKSAFVAFVLCLLAHF